MSETGDELDTVCDKADDEQDRQSEHDEQGEEERGGGKDEIEDQHEVQQECEGTVDVGETSIEGCRSFEEMNEEKEMAEEGEEGTNLEVDRNHWEEQVDEEEEEEEENAQVVDEGLQQAGEDNALGRQGHGNHSHAREEREKSVLEVVEEGVEETAAHEDVEAEQEAMGGTDLAALERLTEAKEEREQCQQCCAEEQRHGGDLEGEQLSGQALEGEERRPFSGFGELEQKAASGEVHEEKAAVVLGEEPSEEEEEGAVFAQEGALLVAREGGEEEGPVLRGDGAEAEGVLAAWPKEEEATGRRGGAMAVVEAAEEKPEHEEGEQKLEHEEGEEKPQHEEGREGAKLEGAEEDHEAMEMVTEGLTGAVEMVHEREEVLVQQACSGEALVQETKCAAEVKGPEVVEDSEEGEDGFAKDGKEDVWHPKEWNENVPEDMDVVAAEENENVNDAVAEERSYNGLGRDPQEAPAGATVEDKNEEDKRWSAREVVEVDEEANGKRGHGGLCADVPPGKHFRSKMLLVLLPPPLVLAAAWIAVELAWCLTPEPITFE